MRVIYTSKGMSKKFGVRVIYRKIRYFDLNGKRQQTAGGGASCASATCGQHPQNMGEVRKAFKISSKHSTSSKQDNGQAAEQITSGLTWDPTRAIHIAQTVPQFYCYKLKISIETNLYSTLQRKLFRTKPKSVSS